MVGNKTSKKFTSKELLGIVFVLAIFLLVIFSPLILQLDNFNILTALFYIVLSIPMLIVSIIAIEAFQKIPYFKDDGSLKNKIKTNRYNLFFVFILYALLIQAFSRFLFIALRGFLSEDILAFYPERSLLLLPAFCAIVIFSLRFLPLLSKKTKKFVDEKKKDLDFIEIIAPEKYLDAIRIVLKDFVIATLLVGYILIIIYSYSGNLPYVYQRQLILIPLIYAIIFWLIDFIIGVTTTTTNPPVFEENSIEEKTEEPQPSLLDKYPKIKIFIGKYSKIIFIIILFIFFVFVISKAYIFVKTPYQNTPISNWAYEIDLDRNFSNNKAQIVFSDSVVTIEGNSSLNLATKIVQFNGQEYPLSERLNDQYKKGVIELEDTEEYIIQKVKGIERNITVRHKQGINLSKTLPNLYYFTTEYDLPLFIALYNNGYEKLYSQGYSRPSATIQQYLKRICTTNGNHTIFIYVNFEGESVLFKDMYIYSEDPKLNLDIENGFSRIEGLNLKIINSSMNCDELYNYEFK